MTGFVGRQDQLRLLADELARVRLDGPKPGRMLAVRGRRQVGKSTLLEEFIQRERVSAVFYTASRQPTDRELELFGAAVAESTTEAAPLARTGSLGSWEAALTLLAGGAGPEKPIVIVIDEFPYLIESVPLIEGTIQKVWDRTLEKTNVLLVLIGSDISMMEKLNEYGRPLYGRCREVLVPPLSPAEIGELLELEAADAFDAFIVIGGFPRLAALWRRGEGPMRFLGRELRDPTTPLVVLGERSLNAEFPADLQARKVLAAIGSGRRGYGAIAQRSGVEQTSLNRALRLLQEKRVVRKLTPYSSKRAARPPRYVVDDSYLRFWLRFIGPNLELIERGRGDVARDRIRASWNDYRGRAVEPLVREAIERMLPDDRFGGTRFVGGYWTQDNRVEVDLVGGRDESSSAVIDFVGSIKWRDDAPFDRGDLAALAAHRADVPGTTTDTLLVGVSRTGFDAAGLDVTLGPGDLLAAWHR